MDTRPEPPPLDTTTADAAFGFFMDAAMRMEPLTWDGEEAATVAEVAAAVVALHHVQRCIDTVLPQLRATLGR